MKKLISPLTSMPWSDFLVSTKHSWLKPFPGLFSSCFIYSFIFNLGIYNILKCKWTFDFLICGYFCLAWHLTQQTWVHMWQQRGFLFFSCSIKAFSFVFCYSMIFRIYSISLGIKILKQNIWKSTEPFSRSPTAKKSLQLFAI